jgi:hypothetical protein
MASFPVPQSPVGPSGRSTKKRAAALGNLQLDRPAKKRREVPAGPLAQGQCPPAPLPRLPLASVASGHLPGPPEYTEAQAEERGQKPKNVQVYYTNEEVQMDRQNLPATLANVMARAEDYNWIANNVPPLFIRNRGDSDAIRGEHC